MRAVGYAWTMSRTLPLRIWIVILALLLLVVLPTTVDFLMDWLWFGEVGYRQVFLTGISASSLFGTVVFAVAFLVLFGNTWLALSTIARPYIVFGMSPGIVRAPVITREQLRRLTILVCATVAIFIGIYGGSHWLTWLRFRHATPFGDADPILGRDVGFYVFRLPMLNLLEQLALLLVLLSLIGSVAAYVVAGVLSFAPRSGIVVGQRARRHLSLLTAVFLLLLAIDAYLSVPQLLITVGGPGTVHGASYTDVAARLPALRILMVVAIAGAGLAIVHAFSSSWWPIPAAFVLYLLTSAGGVVYAATVQRFIVSPNEQTKEAPFMTNNIAATRRAFALENVEQRDLSGDAELSWTDIVRNADTVKNVRLWDHQPLLDTFGQMQEIRTYYDFVSVDNDRYMINGELRQIMLSARELNAGSLPNPTWINERLTFTHGYGLTLGPVNQVTDEGLPVLFIKDLPPQSSVAIDVKEPSLYFGELSSDYVFVKTRATEFHYPKGEDNVYTTYAGRAGVPAAGLWRKLLFSLGFGSMQILFSNDVTGDSRILYHRNITDRVNMIAPFLQYDEDPYLVVSDGRLFWIRDAYTVTGQYPYSTPAVEGVNYIRNSVKVVIDAYNGTTDYYLVDPKDPLALTFASIFPDLFTPLDAMPADLRRHLRYPETIFSLQAAMYSTYHMSTPAVFYNKEDQWEVPAIDTEGSAVPMQPYYTIMRLPGEDRAEFIQMLPFTPRRKDNLAAWMVACSDGSRYGKLAVFQFPKQKVVYGPRQIVARINQDQVISPQITLWNQQGSEVIQGTLLVIPIEESLLYVRPLYLRASGGKIPELKRVIVAYQNQIVMEDTLDTALKRIFGQAEEKGSKPPRASVSAAMPSSPPAGGVVSPADLEVLAARAREQYQRAIQAQRDGDWGLYGEQIRLLGQTLDELARSR
jgi:uncharacterized protein